MALKITKSSEPITVEQIVLSVYGAPGLGKSTLGGAGKILLFDFDGGAYRAANRGDVVQVSHWSDVTDVTAEDLEGYDAVALDTVGRALDALTVAIIEHTPKLGRGGALTLKGWGELKAQFAAWLKLIKSFGLDVILIAHGDEQKDGDDVTERIDVQGSSKNEVYKSSDAMARLKIVGGKRMLVFSPTETAFGKDPAGLGSIEVPTIASGSTFTTDLIGRIKDHLNEESAEQQEVSKILGVWKKKIDEAENAEGLTGLIEESNTIDDRAKATAKKMLMDAAKARDLHYDKETKSFVPDEEEKAEEDEEGEPDEAENATGLIEESNTIDDRAKES